MYSYQNQPFYNVYDQYSSYHVNHANELPGSASVDYLSPTLSQNVTEGVAEVPEIVKRRQIKDEKRLVGRLVVDTSAFSVEERLVAAVWVHERKRTKTTLSKIKKDFLQRFGREPPAKNTLLVWERKLFSSGSVHDAPRPGRPVNRRNKVEEVRASLRGAPTLSLRARAAALCLPRTTLRTILLTDLPHAAVHSKRAPKKTSKQCEPAALAAPRHPRHGYS